jgi:hypothetical protein
MRQIFNKVEKHLLKQNTKSIDYQGFCNYRSAGGLTCAVGCLMTDDMYDPSLEKQGVMEIAVVDALSPILGLDVRKRNDKLNLLVDLQSVHDDYYPVRWHSRLEDLKLVYNIT